MRYPVGVREREVCEAVSDVHRPQRDILSRASQSGADVTATPAWTPTGARTAPLGASDPTRRFALVGADGAVAFPGLTRPEAEAAAHRFSSTGREDVARALLVVTLPVILTDGAGPYLVDATGALSLVLGPHPGIPEACLLMGPPVPRHPIGLARRGADGAWSWLVRAEVAPSQRDVALDALARAETLAEAATMVCVAGAEA